MRPIDRPFRLTLDFCIVWFLLLVGVFLLTRGEDFGPWYSEVAFLIVVPLFATFFLYGPVLLVRQMIRSGSRGGLVVRVFLSVMAVAMLMFGALLISGYHTVGRARNIGFWFSVAAPVYLGWRLNQCNHDS